jgi:sn-glycerol 3-phosphate transport system substrate-binding protein
MTADTSAALGTVLAVLGSGQYSDVQLGVAPLPGPSGGGATFVAGGANYIVKGDAPEKVEAAWRFAKYLDEPEVQAKWSASGYIPIVKAAVDLPEVQQLWQTTPFYRVAYDQLAKEVDTVAATGPVIGDFTGVRDAVIDSMEQMVTNHVDPKDALDAAKKKSDDAIADYNSRAG